MKYFLIAMSFALPASAQHVSAITQEDMTVAFDSCLVAYEQVSEVAHSNEETRLAFLGSLLDSEELAEEGVRAAIRSENSELEKTARQAVKQCRRTLWRYTYYREMIRYGETQ